MITVTETAAARVRQQLQTRGSGLGIRIGVKVTGCSGLAYVLEFVDNPRSDDEIIDTNGIKLFVNPKHYDILRDLEIDWVTEGLNSGFKFNNPLERDRCGCGQSFRV